MIVDLLAWYVSPFGTGMSSNSLRVALDDVVAHPAVSARTRNAATVRLMLMFGAYQGPHSVAKKFGPAGGARASELDSTTTFARPRSRRFSPLRKRARRNGTSGDFPSSPACDSAEDGIAAVHRDGGPGDEVGGGARQEHGHAGHVLEGAPASGRRPPEHVVVELGDLAARAPGQIGIDPPREHRVHLDVVPGPGGRE